MLHFYWDDLYILFLSLCGIVGILFFLMLLLIFQTTKPAENTNQSNSPPHAAMQQEESHTENVEGEKKEATPQVPPTNAQPSAGTTETQ